MDELHRPLSSRLGEGVAGGSYWCVCMGPATLDGAKPGVATPFRTSRGKRNAEWGLVCHEGEWRGETIFSRGVTWVI